MKKFYYKKEEENIDRTPIILRLERRCTINASEDNARDEQREISARTASISSLDTLRDAPTIPRARTRDVAKSLSEDILNKGQSRVPKRVITEAELSSSLLYKSMKASVNSKFKSPNKAVPCQQTEDLEPVVLQDPKMKPIPVNSSRSRRRSCLCRFATVTIISLFTVGFLAAIAGVIYMEILDGKNLTSYETSETSIDLSELALDSIQDREELRTHDILIEREHTLQKFPRKIPETRTIDISSNETDGHNGANSRMLDFEKSGTELNQFIDGANTKIKFRDGETVIYEVKSSNSMEYGTSSVVSDGFKGGLNSFFNTENSSSKDENVSDVGEVELKKNLETILDSQFEKLKDELDLSEENSESEPQDANYDEGRRLKGTVSLKTKPAVFESPVKSNKDPEVSESDIELKVSESSIKLQPINSDLELGSETGLNPEAFDETLNIPGKENEAKFSESNQESHMQNKVEILPSVQYLDEDQQDRGDHDVGSMTMVIDDPEEQGLNSFISNRNGDINPFETTLLDTKSTSTKIESKHSEARKNKPESVVQWQLITEPPLPKRPVDMKVSLAEAMKHLQVLDVNNKLLASRMKPVKPKVVSTKLRRPSNIPQKKEDVNLEKMQYLKKVRLMLYEQLQ